MDDNLDQFADELGELMRKYPPTQFHEGIGQIAIISTATGNLAGFLIAGGVDSKTINSMIKTSVKNGLSIFKRSKEMADKAKNNKADKKPVLRVVK